MTIRWPSPDVYDHGMAILALAVPCFPIMSYAVMMVSGGWGRVATGVLRTRRFFQLSSELL